MLALAIAVLAESGAQPCNAAQAEKPAEARKFDVLKLAQNAADKSAKPAAKTVAAASPPASSGATTAAPATSPAAKPAEKPAAAGQKPADKVVKEDSDPGFIAALNKGVELFNKSKYQEAADEFQKAISINERNVGARNWLGAAYQRLNKHKEAAEVLEKVVELDPDWAEAHNNLAYSYQMLQDYENAESEYKRALEIKPDFTEGRYNLGCVLQFEKKNDEAIKEFEEILKAKPTQERQLDVYLRIGDMARDGNDNAKALQYYNKALELNKKDPTVQTKIYLLEPDPTKRKDGLEKILDLDPANYEALLNLGIIAYQGKDFTTALDYLGKALARNPYDAAVHYWLGRYYFSLDSMKSAIKQFTDAQKCDAVDKKIPEIEEWLNKAKEKQASF